MSIRKQLAHRIAEPAVLRFLQWRGDPVARLVLPGTKADPYPLYDDLRQRALRRSVLGGWATSDHATAAAILRDQRFSSSPRHQPGYQPVAYPAGDPRADLPAADLLTLDPPDHTRIRRLVTSAFGARTVAGLEPWIRALTTRLLDRAGGAAEFDLIDVLAFPLPIGVICHLLGVPASDQDRFRAWGHEVAAALEPQTSPTAERQSRAAELALTAYLHDLVRRRRSDPDDSLLSALVAVEQDGDRLTTSELVSTALLLLVAGFETTVNLIGNGTVAMLAAREQWERLVAEPELAPTAVEELLRYDSPVQLTSRIATDDIGIAGQVIPRGAAVIVAIGGANRDPAVFSDPGQLRIDRLEAAKHLSFSLGMHHCLGAALARLEGRIAFEELTRRFPRLELAGQPVRRPLLVLRGFEHVVVRAG